MNLCLFLNHACNLRCGYCYNGEKHARPMPLEVARAGVELALTSGSPARSTQITLFGGEPLLELELMSTVLDYARARAAERDRALRFVVVTNGTLLDGARLDLLRRHRVHVGVSLDGDAAAHDACRRFPDGSSSHALVARNVEQLVANHPELPLKTISVVDPANVAMIADSFSFLRGLGVEMMSMNLNYQARWGEDQRAQFEVALRALGARYVEAYRRGERFRLDLLDAKIVTGVKGGYGCGDRCDFGCEELAVAPSGRLYPCDRLVGEDDGDDVVIGDVRTGVDRARRDALIASKNQVLEGCADCALQPRCMHWCGCVNRAMTGAVGEVDGLLCWFEQRLIEEADRCASALYAEQNETFLGRFYGTLSARAPAPG